MLGGIDPEKAEVQAAFRDPRLKAGFATVPFMGASFGVWPLRTDAWHFGRDFSGLAQVKLPFFAAYAERYKSVDPDSVRAAVRQLSGPTWALELPGEGHMLSQPAERETYAWELLFFDAFLRGNAAARARLSTGKVMPQGAQGRITYISVGR